MNKIHEGWLTKSPPEWRKHMSLFKLKWRKRYFVLYSAPASSVDHKSYQAQLSYYENGTLSKECGKIDLKNCEEVVSQLETDEHQYVMSLKTVCKNQTRVYYLSSDSEDDLLIWVEKISFVLTLLGNEFIETTCEDEGTDMLKNSGTKTSDKNKKEKKVRNKQIGISLRRSSSVLSKSSTCLLQGASSKHNKFATNLSSPSFTTNIGFITYRRISKFENSVMNSLDSSDSENSLSTPNTSLSGRPSFLSKIKQLKTNPRRPSCPLIIPAQNDGDEYLLVSTPTVLRPSAHKHNQPSRFQGSSGSSILSFASDYKTQDVSSPSLHATPPIFYQPTRKYEVTEYTIKFDDTSFYHCEPPPLPPKKRYSDSGLPDESGTFSSNGTSNSNSIYDVPVHKYGNCKVDAPLQFFEEDEPFDEFDCYSRFEGTLLSVVNELENEGQECEYCYSLADDQNAPLESVPPPLPERTRPREQGSFLTTEGSIHSSDSDYDILPFSTNKCENDSSNFKRSSGNASSDDSDAYDYLPSALENKISDVSQDPPPLPKRNKKRVSKNLFDDFAGLGHQHRISESFDNVYDHIGTDNFKSDENITEQQMGRDIFNSKSNLIQIPISNVDESLEKQKDAFTADRPQRIETQESSESISMQKGSMSNLSGKIIKHSLTKKKSKSLENICQEMILGSEWESQAGEPGHVNFEGKDGSTFIRTTFKTRSFKRKSTECKQSPFTEEECSLSSSVSSISTTSVDDERKPVLVIDNNLY